MKYKIPFTKTTLGEEEKKAIADVIDSGWVVMGDKTKQFEEEFAKYVGAKYAVCVDSGTSALFLSFIYLKPNIKILKEYIAVPSITFTSTAEIVVHGGCKPFFVDVDKKTLCMDGYSAQPLFTIPVHLLGNKADTEAKMYDSAHRIERDDVKDSNALWCYSFYATKNMTAIQCGMIATNDENAALWLQKARDHGISKGTQERYQNGDWEYSIDFVGWRVKPDDIRATVGIEQLKKLDWARENRNALVRRYNSALERNFTGNHIYPIFVENRRKFIDFMYSRGIQTSVHFLPLHNMQAYKEYPHNALPVTEYVGEHLVSLPLYPQMTIQEQDEVINAIKESGIIYE